MIFVFNWVLYQGTLAAPEGGQGCIQDRLLAVNEQTILKHVKVGCES